ncbi:MAG: cytochrome c peroxidase [Candidatus Promineifilaceae bacterium]|nr:cytochrome c peroxidase [Candidatus Promineifilaceae bacterium]
MELGAVPGGAVLVAEAGSGADDHSAGVTLVAATGHAGRLISGLPSRERQATFDEGPLVGVSPTSKMIYVGHFGSDRLWRYAVPAATFDPPRDPLSLSSLSLVAYGERPNRALVPAGLTFNDRGTPVILDGPTGAILEERRSNALVLLHTLHTNGTASVPTAIARSETGEYLVTLSDGCPSTNGRLVAVDDQGNERTVAAGLHAPVDVAQGADGTIWIVELTTSSAAACRGERAERSGRLSRLGPEGLEPILTDLDEPSSVLPMADGSLVVAERRAGRLLRVTFQPASALLVNDPPELGRSVPQLDYDALLRAVVAREELVPHPGIEHKEAPSALTELGQLLFFDPILGGDQNIACATCHHPTHAMADGRVLPIGVGGVGLGPGRSFDTKTPTGSESGRAATVNPFLDVYVPRNSPTIINAALLEVQFWDGRVSLVDGVVRTPEHSVDSHFLTDVLTAQALFPVTSEHEMAGITLGGQTPDQVRRTLHRRLLGNADYRQLFLEVYGTAAPSMVDISAALAAFQRQFIFTAAPWDAYLAGDEAALTEAQKRGALLFFGVLKPEVNCAACHSGDLFTDLQFHDLLVPQLGPGKGHGLDGREDWGRGGITGDPADRYSFRTPPLRNVALTAPYFHSGAYPTLEDAIWHHADIWRAGMYDPGRYLSGERVLYGDVRPFVASDHAQTAARTLRRGLPLTHGEVDDLVAFLHALTDPTARDLSDFIPEQVPSGLPLD